MSTIQNVFQLFIHTNRTQNGHSAMLLQLFSATNFSLSNMDYKIQAVNGKQVLVEVQTWDRENIAERMTLSAETLPNDERQLEIRGFSKLNFVRVLCIGSMIYISFGDKIIKIEPTYKVIEIYTEKYTVTIQTNDSPFNVSLSTDEALINLPQDLTTINVNLAGVAVQANNLTKSTIDRTGANMNISGNVQQVDTVKTTAEKTYLELTNDGDVNADFSQSYMVIQSPIQKVALTVAEHNLHIEAGVPHIVLEPGNACIEIRASHKLPELNNILRPFQPPTEDPSEFGPHTGDGESVSVGNELFTPAPSGGAETWESTLPSSTWSEWGNMGNNGGSETTAMEQQLTSAFPQPAFTASVPSTISFPSPDVELVPTTSRTTTSFNTDRTDVNQISTTPLADSSTTNGIPTETFPLPNNFTSATGEITTNLPIINGEASEVTVSFSSPYSTTRRSSSSIPQVTATSQFEDVSPTTKANDEVPVPPTLFPTLIVEQDTTKSSTGATDVLPSDDTEKVIVQYASTSPPWEIGRTIEFEATLSDVQVGTTQTVFEESFPAPSLLLKAEESKGESEWSGGASDAFPQPNILSVTESSASPKKRSVLVLKLKIPEGVDIKDFDFASNITSGLIRAARAVSSHENRRKRSVDDDIDVQIEQIVKENDVVEVFISVREPKRRENKDVSDLSQKEIEAFLPFPVISIMRVEDSTPSLNFALVGAIVFLLSLICIGFIFRMSIKSVLQKVCCDVCKDRNPRRQSRIHSADLGPD